MGDKTGIGWTDATWNPVTGCSHVSPGCDHCYAETLSLRYGWSKLPWTPENADENVILHPERLDRPARWRKPRMIFVNSMSDLFHPNVPGEFINEVWMQMYNNPRHTFQILTKRPKRLRDWTIRKANVSGWPVDEIWPEWMWVGTSIESREYVGRADLLRETPAAVRFISAEPLLGPLVHDDGAEPVRQLGRPDPSDWVTFWSDPYDGPQLDLSGISWLIVGGESGRGHRPMRVDWVRDLRDAAMGDGICAYCDHGFVNGAIKPEACSAPGCREGRTGGCAFFFKQHGGVTPKAGGRELDGRTWDEIPRRQVERA